MGHRVFLSPSDQDKNTYAAGNTNEAVQCGRIADAAKAALERCGFETMLVHYENMASKCAKSDAFGAELHVPIHSNAFDGKVSGTRIFYGNPGGESHKAAKAILTRLGAITPGGPDLVQSRPELYEINTPKAPTAYIETDFHDVPDVAAWIIGHTVEIGEAICAGICDYFGVAYRAPEKEENEMRYKTINDVPAWAKKETQELIDSGALKGNENGLDVTDDMLRTMIISKRYADSIACCGRKK